MRVLVVFGSSRGGTAGLANMVAEAFVARGVLADIGNAADVDDISGYDVVILGGALYNDHWHADASDFVERNLDALLRTPVWFFSSGPLDDSARSGALAPVTQVQELARLADIRGHMTFGGVLEKRPSRLFSSFMAYGKPGDFRDRQQVEEWAARIIARLDEAPPVVTLPAPPGDPVEPADTSGAKRGHRRLSRRKVDEDLGLDVISDS